MLQNLGGGVLPGTVTAFSGTFNDGYPINKNTGLVDKEWHLCDGTNGTPDLSGKFILGKSDNHAAGSTGGEETHTLTQNEIPQLNIKSDQFSGVMGGSIVASSGDNMGFAPTNGFSSGARAYTLYVGNSSGAADAHNNMPPYYALAFIMKL